MSLEKSSKNNWLALMIGNSRLHWAWFQGESLRQVWHTTHLREAVNPGRLPTEFLPPSLRNLAPLSWPLYMASVVPQQTAFWQTYSHQYCFTLRDIPLRNTYATLGIDRALAVWGAGYQCGFPVLVVDGGTALTLTGVAESGNLIGGAILPGLSSQFTALQQTTAALPQVTPPERLPPQWPNDTATAMASGVVHTLVAGIADFWQDWQQRFPSSKLLFTGGDGIKLHSYLREKFPDLGQDVIVEAQLIFFGMLALVESKNGQN